MRKLLSIFKKLVIDLLNVVPVNSSVIGTPRRCLTMDSCLKENPTIKYIHLREESVVKHELPILNNSLYSKSYAKVAERIMPGQKIAIMPDGRVWGRNGAVITESDVFIKDVSREFGVSDACKGHSVFHNLSLGKPRYIDGNVAVITTAGANVYYHWLLDILPRYIMLKEAGVCDQLDYVVLDYAASRFQKETLAVVGLSEEKILNCKDERDFHIKAKQLFVPTLMSSLSEVNLYESELLRKYFLKGKKSSKGKRIYISRRGGTRELENEQELLVYLKRNGFEVVMPEEYTVEEQAAIFNNADMIVGPHGSAYANVVFCQKGAKLIDIIPKSNVIPCFYSISKNVGVSYYGFIDKAIPVNDSIKNDNVKIDMPSFISFFEKHLV